MGNILNRLTARAITSKTKPGRYADGGGLYLVVSKSGAKRWSFFWRSQATLGLNVAGKSKTNTRREMGLGSINAVSLARARELAGTYRTMVAEGLDPIEERKKDRAGQSRAPTFGECANAVIEAMRPQFRSDKHAAQWAMTLTTYCEAIRGKPVDTIDTDDILAVLTPHWQRVPETASRLRGRIEKVLDAAKAKGYRTADNPARWRGHLDHLLPARQKLARGHHEALPYSELPAFLAALRDRDGIASMLLEFIILTACRTGEARLSTWGEIDLDSGIWTLTPERMKAKRGHRVPLVGRAVEILQFMARITDAANPSAFLFPSARKIRPLSNMTTAAVLRRIADEPDTPESWKKITTHGFRSSFKDWCSEETSFSRELAETALAHTIGNEAERAYRRGDALEKRRTVMEAWDRFCSNESDKSNVVSINAK